MGTSMDDHFEVEEGSVSPSGSPKGERDAEEGKENYTEKDPLGDDPKG